MSKWLCESCRHNTGKLYKTYTDNLGEERTIKVPYVRCSKRWTRPMLAHYEHCWDYERRGR